MNPPADLIFLMGKYEARFPIDRLYATNHMWLKPLAGENVYRVGFTAYSVRLLRDVYFLDWSIGPGTEVVAKQQIGEIESSKAVSSLYIAQPGRIIEFNEQLLADPSAINVDTYGAGWLFDFESRSQFLTPQQYLDHLHATWDETQRMIGKQMKQD